MDESDFGKLLSTNVPHILEEIFLSLDFQSFKNCHRVCKAWNRFLSAESLHQKAKKLLSHNNQRLHLALTEGNANKLERILSNGMVDVNDEDGLHKLTAALKAPRLHGMSLASYHGYKEVVWLLLKAGADAQLLNRILPLWIMPSRAQVQFRENYKTTKPYVIRLSLV